LINAGKREGEREGTVASETCKRVAMDDAETQKFDPAALRAIIQRTLDGAELLRLTAISR